MAENNFSLQKTLTMLLDEKKYHSLRDILSTMNPADIAAIFDDLDQAEQCTSVGKEIIDQENMVFRSEEFLG